MKLGEYFGRIARFGPSNLIDFHPYFDTQLGVINLEVDCVVFWQFSKDDGTYGPPLILDDPSVNNERFIGNQIGVIARYEFNHYLNFELESNVIFPEAFLEESGLGDILYHFVFTTEFKF